MDEKLRQWRGRSNSRKVIHLSSWFGVSTIGGQIWSEKNAQILPGFLVWESIDFHHYHPWAGLEVEPLSPEQRKKKFAHFSVPTWKRVSGVDQFLNNKKTGCTEQGLSELRGGGVALGDDHSGYVVLLTTDFWRGNPFSLNRGSPKTLEQYYNKCHCFSNCRPVARKHSEVGKTLRNVKTGTLALSHTVSSIVSSGINLGFQRNSENTN